MFDLHEKDFVSLNRSLEEKLVFILSKWIKVLVIMLLLYNIESCVNESLSLLVEDLGTVVGVWQNYPDQAVVGLDLLVVHSHDEVLLVPGVHWAGLHSVVLLANALMNLMCLRLQTNLFKRLCNSFLKWLLTLVLSSI